MSGLHLLGVRFLPPHPFYVMKGGITTGSTPTYVGWSDFTSVMTALNGQISVSNVVGVLAGSAGAAVGLVFLWWAVRKGTSALMSAFRKGRLRL